MSEEERGLAMKMQRVQDGQAAARRSKPSAAPGNVSGKARPSGGRLLALLRRGDEGQSLVELALTLPILMALIMGLFSIGNGMIVYEQLGEAAFAGDQAMASNEGVDTPGTTTQVDLCAKAYTAVTTVLAAPAWSTANLNKITYSATLAKAGVTTPVPASTGSFSCATLSTDLGPKSQATLTLSYPYKWLPIYGIKLGSITITRQQSVLAY
jgi:Flp pilus assembly protein TadG